jgi:hypothetical protein
MFTHPGWKHFEDDMERNLSSLNKVDNIMEADAFWVRKGQVQTLINILGYQEAAKAVFEELERDESI